MDWFMALLGFIAGLLFGALLIVLKNKGHISNHQDVVPILMGMAALLSVIQIILRLIK